MSTLERQVEKIRSTLKCFHVKNSPATDHYFDISKWYAELSKYPEVITEEVIRVHPRVGDTTFPPDMPRGLLMCCIDDAKYDVYANEVIPEKINRGDYSGYNLIGGDGYYDIVVKNATFATLHLGGGNPTESFGKYQTNIELDKKDETTFTFVDFTIDNLLFASELGSDRFIHTDGELTYKIAFISKDSTRDICFKLNKLYTVSVMPSRSKYVFIGHVWMPPFTCDFNQTEEVNRTSQLLMFLDI